jgi:aspartyl/asparaginyl beta-hydroxylase (cupin superfamily)
MAYFIYDPYRAVEWWNPIVDYFAKDREINDMMEDLWDNRFFILDEFDEKRNEYSMPVGDLNKYERYLAGDDKKWKMLPIRYLKLWKNEEVMPVTTSLLRPYSKYMGNAYISILEAGKIIPPHRGPYTGVQRVHIPLRVPKGDLGLQTKHGIHRWDRPFYFIDAEPHQAWNRTEEERVVLIFDIFRELPPGMQQLHELFVSMATMYAKRLK